MAIDNSSSLSGSSGRGDSSGVLSLARSLSASAAARRMSSKVGLSVPEVFGGIPIRQAPEVRPTKEGSSAGPRVARRRVDTASEAGTF